MVRKGEDDSGWTWDDVDRLSSSSGILFDWLDQSSLEISIDMALRGFWGNEDSKFPANHLISDIIFSTPRKVCFDSDTLFLLSCPSRVRTVDELKSLLRAVLSRDPRRLLPVKKQNRNLLGTWGMIVEYWRRVYPEGVYVRPRLNHILCWNGDLDHGVRVLAPLGPALKHDWCDILEWLNYRLSHPSRRPFQPPTLWASPAFIHTLKHGLDGIDLTEFTPRKDTDEVFVMAARFLAVCIGIMRNKQKNRQRPYEYHKQLVRSCLSVLYRSKAGTDEVQMHWDNFIVT